MIDVTWWGSKLALPIGMDLLKIASFIFFHFISFHVESYLLSASEF